MDFEDKKFDVIIDKGTFDSILVDNKANYSVQIPLWDTSLST